MIETCKRDSTRHFLHPIIDWSTEAVWAYVRNNRLPYCCLYDEGFDRIGCIMCPMAERRRHLDAIRWPKYARAYIRAMDKMVAKRIADGLPTQWKNGQEAYDWWMSEPKRKTNEDYSCWLFDQGEESDLPSVFVPTGGMKIGDSVAVAVGDYDVTLTRLEDGAMEAEERINT